MKAKRYPLDLSALAYPMMRTKRTESNYRFSAEMRTEVDPHILIESLCEVLPRYPVFRTRVAASFFWHELKENHAPLLVKEDDMPPLRPLRKEDTNGYPFRLAYKGEQVVLEVFHAVTDANVASLFFADILTRYTEIKEGIGESELPERALNVEDAFLLCGKKKKLCELSLKSYNGDSVYALGKRGKYREYPELLSLELPLDEVKAAAKKCGVTITEYVAAAYLSAITQGEPLPLKKAVCLFIPIDLRRYFKTQTMQNFVAFERIFLPKGESDLSFERVLSIVHEEFSSKITAQNMQSHVDDVRRALTLPIVKYTPLFIKQPLFKLVKCLLNKVRQTAILSNVGRIELPERAMKYIKNVKFFLNNGKNAPVNLAVNTFGDTLNINVTNGLEEPDIPNRLFATLTSQGKK